jgi:hypothetical protein
MTQIDRKKLCCDETKSAPDPGFWQINDCTKALACKVRDPWHTESIPEGTLPGGQLWIHRSHTSFRSSSVAKHTRYCSYTTVHHRTSAYQPVEKKVITWLRLDRHYRNKEAKRSTS